MKVAELKKLLENVDENKDVIFYKQNAISLVDGWETPIMEKIENFEERKCVIVLG